MRRFFYNSSLHHTASIEALHQRPLGDSLCLTDDIYHHWCRVLRAKVGEQSWIFDGLGGQSLVELESIDKKSATVKIIHQDTAENTCNYHSTIALVMSRGDRMDYAIQKATELGATTIQLLTSQHGEVRLKANQVDKKLSHWQQVALSASEQCRLNRPTLILSPLSIEQWLQGEMGAVHHMVQHLYDADYYQSYLQQPILPLVLAVPSQQEQQTLDVNAQITDHFALANIKGTNPDSTAACLPRFEILIGAEGGLSEAEYQLARNTGYLPWQLGNRILRTETAPVVALATLMYISTNAAQS
ncbi:16S rRNA (uracil(1498)-N(3))-methyltransferase [Psychrobacter sanguinis]|uniref:Ribosomal RNA small subunit methyltransferase E n=1 Tax=Psychrobacter sanguinis TaxID=861445 RepID=A0A844LZP2_9GAMM|nr:16S rRNA (uracil(1498)-N(3))-methyltransferase [Psychrobacter sanguinis]MUG31890.1 16S rRNA (uracil(1498)-N(3))-methyltransferase [Psychrobacter sanguinis]